MFSVWYFLNIPSYKEKLYNKRILGGWGSSGYDSSQPGYGLRRTNKDYSDWGIFSSLNLANIFQLVLRSSHNGLVRLKYCCRASSGWMTRSVSSVRAEILMSLIPPGPPWFIIVQWRGRWPGRGNDRITRGWVRWGWDEGDVRTVRCHNNNKCLEAESEHLIVHHTK